MQWRTAGVAAASLGVALVTAVGAGTYRTAMELLASDELTYHTLVSRSEGIYVGRIQSLSCAWSPDESRILTTVVMDVDEVIKGEEEREVSFQIQGGRIGEIGNYVSHQPTFVVGEEVIVQVRRYTHGTVYRRGQTVVSNGPTGVWHVNRMEPEEGERADSLIAHLAAIASGRDVATVKVASGRFSGVSASVASDN